MCMAKPAAFVELDMPTNDQDGPPQYPVRYPPIARADGINESERYLQRLCERSFLRLWSYPGIHRDQGGGKEVADLIVVFGDDVIIFSDKSCAFGNTGNLATDWGRWYRKSVRDSANQARAAEKWILKYPERLYLDIACTKPFPLQLPPAGRARIHRVVVAHGVADACRAAFKGGSGSLMLMPIIGDTDKEPFTVGDLDPSRGFVHILDDTTLEILLTTLDTVGDFVAYLREKESWVRGGHLLSAAGEEELLALYLMGGDKNGHALPREKSGAISVVPEGEWLGFLAGPHRRAQVEANRISYAWDGLIGEFERHFIAGTSEFRTHADVKELEPMLRYLASENRTRRRGLATELVNIIHKPFAPNSLYHLRVAATEDPNQPAYVFLSLARSTEHSDVDYRELRRRMMEGYVLVTRLKMPQYKNIIGIATEPHVEGANRSEDLYLLREEDWSPHLEEEARKFSELGMLRETTRHDWRVVEYPVEDLTAARGARAVPATRTDGTPYSRNRPCPCGTGHKYKKCCGRM